MRLRNERTREVILAAAAFAVGLAVGRTYSLRKAS